MAIEPDTARSPDVSVRLDVLQALARALEDFSHRIQIGEAGRHIVDRGDARQLDLQLADEDVGDMLVELAYFAIGAEQREGRRDHKADKRDCHNSQRQ